ncbi:hypothetical protein T4D_3504 [Trichinella pseudospiralis]|uniref:Uncharacterized protein n=1 Tax=Trichinella pseudospiralis TaxID=6337 RepID=A0A0V1FWC0_TRIPS|nr:hypothetical protein T4D_3504 [Trichinella pseudospiralis]
MVALYAIVKHMFDILLVARNSKKQRFKQQKLINQLDVSIEFSFPTVKNRNGIIQKFDSPSDIDINAAFHREVEVNFRVMLKDDMDAGSCQDVIGSYSPLCNLIGLIVDDSFNSASSGGHAV